jgi:hypothetical protein
VTVTFQPRQDNLGDLLGEAGRQSVPRGYRSLAHAVYAHVPYNLIVGGHLVTH